MLFILDRNEKVIDTLREDVDLSYNGAVKAPFFDDTFTQDLASGSDVFEFSTLNTPSLAQSLIVGNFIAFKVDDKFKLFQITNTTDTHEDTFEIRVYCESAGLQLINSVFRATKLISCDLQRFLKNVLQDTGWDVGDVFLSEKVLDLDIETASCYSALQNNISSFDAELDFRVEIENNIITGKYVDAYLQKGRVTGIRFEYGKNVDSVKREVDSSDLYTALIGEGNNSVNFKNVVVEGIDKPLGQDYVGDKEAFERYNYQGRHLMGSYKFETTSPEELLRETYKKLQEVKTPKITYEVSVAILGEDIRIGDTINVIDNYFNPPLYLQARVSKLETSMSNPKNNTCTLANFVEVSSNIDDSIKQIATQLKGYIDTSVGGKFPIGSSEIQDDAIKENHIARDTITTDMLKAQVMDTVVAKIHSAIIENAEIVNAQINYLEVNKASISELRATNAIVNNLEAGYANINSLVSGNLTSGNIQTGGITGDSLNMNTIFVNDANILDLSASKITTGQLNTQKVEIASPDGSLKMLGNLMQFKDENSNVRLQLGKDAQGNFTFSLFDETGTGLLIDSAGIKEGALGKDIIKEDMISDGAVSGAKIDMKSFASSFNGKTNTATIDSTKVFVDDEKQTLDVAFSKYKSETNNNKTNINNLQTQFTVEQGKITDLIGATQIEKDGKILTLKDAYNETVKTVESNKTTISQQQSVIDEQSGQIISTQEKVSTLEQNTDNLSLVFRSTGGANLLRNGTWIANLNSWNIIDWQTGGNTKQISVWTNHEYVPSGKTALVIQATDTQGHYGVEQIVDVTPNTNYCFNVWVAQHRCSEVDIVIKNNDTSQTWLAYEKCYDIPLANLDGTGYVNKSFKFNSGNNTKIRVALVIADSDSDGYCWFYEAMLNVGTKVLAYQNNAGENYEGVLQADATGITVKHNSGSSARFSKDGCNWKDETGNPIMEINGQGLEYYSPMTKKWVGFIKSSQNADIEGYKGMTIATSGNGDYIALSICKATERADVWASSNVLSIESKSKPNKRSGLHFWSANAYETSTYVHNHTDYIQERGNIFMNNQTLYFSKKDVPYPSWIGATDDENALGIFGINKIAMGVRHDDINRNAIIIEEGKDRDNITIYQPINMRNNTLSNANFQNCTSNYALTNAFTRKTTIDSALKSYTESTRYLYSNMKFKNNKLTLSIPNVYKSFPYTIASIVKLGRGDVWVSEQHEDYFILESDSDISVNVEIDIQGLQEALSTIAIEATEEAQVKTLEGENLPIEANDIYI